MYQAILLDMDNTLLDIDFDGFLREYIQLIARRFADRVRPDVFQQQLLASTKAMVDNDDPNRTVLQAFIDDFLPALNLPESTIGEFMDFYQNEYRELKGWGQPMPHARRLVERAFARGIKVVVATAPLFPLEAVRERLRWAEADDFPYHFITAADTMHYSKPYPRYYAEIAERIGVPPTKCLMIGDSTLMDGPAADIGMDVALVGPRKPSNTVAWLSGFSDAIRKDEQRYPSVEALLEVLMTEGIL